MFFSFDGLDGVGKSTQMNLFVDWLGQQGYDVVSCCDPGSTPAGVTTRPPPSSWVGVAMTPVAVTAASSPGG